MRILALILLLPVPLKAESQPHTPLMLTITKQAAADRKESLASPDAEITRQYVERIPGGANLTRSEAWEGMRASTIKDLFDYTPGIFAQPRNAAESARLSVRGSGITRIFQGRGLLLLQDGIPLNTADGSFDFQSIDPWLIDHAVLLRGANGMSLGSATLGGAIAFSSPTGYTAAPYQARGEMGSFGHRHVSLSTGRLMGDRDVYAAAVGFESDGFRDWNEQDSVRLLANAGWHIRPGLENRWTLSHTDSRAEIPGSLTKAQIFRDARQANAANRIGRFARDQQITRIGNHTAWRGGSQEIDSTVFGSMRKLDNPATTYIDSRERDGGWRGTYRHDGEGVAFSVGGHLHYGETDEERHRNVGGRRGSRVVTREQEALTAALYPEADFTLTADTRLTLGAQLAYAAREVAESFPAPQQQKTGYYGFSPRIGMRFEALPTLTLFGNVSRSFEPPTLSELSAGNVPGFAKLDAQTATTAEVGMRGDGVDESGERFFWEAVFYRAWIKDEFVTYRFPDGSTSTVNAGHSYHQGAELGGGGELWRGVAVPSDHVDLRLSYLWNDFRLQNDVQFGDSQLAGVPEHLLRAELFYRHPSGFGVGPNIEWVPNAYPIDLANTVNTESYALLGARAEYTLEEEDFSLYLEARNLLDTTYIATTGVIPNGFGGDPSQFFPGDGRSFYIGFRHRW